MKQLFIIADDFTGALDTGVQFAAWGAGTRVVTDLSYDFSQAEAEVLVLDAETRHLPPKDSYETVFQAVRKALEAGFEHIYKKTDSALRGNIGAELSAVMDAAGAERFPFLPAFPRLRRTTWEGIHYIDGVPVAESVFGQDPFEPVRHSKIAEIIAQQTSVPVVLRNPGQAMDGLGIQIYDAERDEDLLETSRKLGRKGLKISAGCAGFASVLAELLELNGAPPVRPELVPALFVACGSVNPVTLRQMDMAERAGFPRVHLTPVQKLEASWLETPDCAAAAVSWLDAARKAQRFILDVNDPEGSSDTMDYAKEHGLTTEDLRIRISSQLGHLVQRLLDEGLDATILCTGGDTLLALMRAVGIAELTPAGELDAGAVLTNFVYLGKTYHIISKSGGFGEPNLFCTLARSIGAGNQKEDAVC